jgi:Polyketide cyclase / dehydrase and lipid transport
MAGPVVFEQERAIPVEVKRAYAATLTTPLPVLFRRRYGALPPVREVRDQAGVWGDLHQTRTVVTSDGGTMREQLTEVDPPQAFGYHLSDITGPMRPLVAGIDGRWEFTPIGTGTLVTWRWTLIPRSVGAPVMPVLARMWRGYARQALELLSEQLLQPSTPD